MNEAGQPHLGKGEACPRSVLPGAQGEVWEVLWILHLNRHGAWYALQLSLKAVAACKSLHLICIIES